MMQELPCLTETAIRERASAQSWARGLDYFDRGNVIDVIWRDGLLVAQVWGSAYEPYRVQVSFDEDRIRFADCTCPYDWGGDCKHIIAVLLHLVHTPDSVEQRPSVTALLADLSRDELVDLIVELADAAPQLVEDLERVVLQIRVAGEAAPSASAAAIDAALLRRQIGAELRDLLRSEHTYDEWGDSWYDLDLGAALEPALQRTQAYLETDDPRSALAVLEVATEAWDVGIDSLQAYERESFEDVAETFTVDLGALWAEAILSAELSADERAQWQVVLEEFAETIFGGASLDIAVTAAAQGWEYAPLVAAMGGHITPEGAWAGEAPYFADDLAEIRLRILEQRGQYEAYLNLAQAEGQFMRYLQMLVRQGQSERAVAEAREHLTHAYGLHVLAEALLAQGEDDRAFDLARHGLALEADRGSVRLAEWLRDQARAHDRPELALWAARRALEFHATLENYRALRELAGDDWAALRSQALEAVEQDRSIENQVDVYLYEQMYQRAIEAVDQATWFHRIEPVIEAVQHEFPDWAFDQCRRRAEAIMDAGRARDYGVAADWLRQGRDVLLAADRKPLWDDYLAQLMDEHHRKYKLMPMLRALA